MILCLLNVGDHKSVSKFYALRDFDMGAARWTIVMTNMYLEEEEDLRFARRGRLLVDFERNSTVAVAHILGRADGNLWSPFLGSAVFAVLLCRILIPLIAGS